MIFNGIEQEASCEGELLAKVSLLKKGLFMMATFNLLQGYILTGLIAVHVQLKFLFTRL